MSDKRFTITIMEHTTERKTLPRAWVKDAGSDHESASGNFGYAPEVETVVDVSREIYAQNTDDLNLVEVIKAVNKL